MNPTAGQSVVKVRHRTYWSVLYVSLGGLLFLSGLLSLALLEGFPVYMIVGLLFLVGGILSFFNPIFSFDRATGALYMHSLLGNRARTYGAPKGEALFFDGANIMRRLPNGKQRKVSTYAANPQDVALLVQIITGAPVA